MPTPKAVASQSPGEKRVSQERNQPRQWDREVSKPSIKESTVVDRSGLKITGSEE